jgi:hypothetical protein
LGKYFDGEYIFLYNVDPGLGDEQGLSVLAERKPEAGKWEKRLANPSHPLVTHAKESSPQRGTRLTCHAGCSRR